MPEDENFSTQKPENFKAPIIGYEGEKSIERTREEDIQKNIELWQHLGIEVDHNDIKTKITGLPNVGDFSWSIYIPKGLQIGQMIELMRNQGYKIKIDQNINNIDKIQSPRETDQSYVITSRFTNLPDEAYDKLGSVFHDNNYMTPLEGLVSIALFDEYTADIVHEDNHEDEADYSDLSPDEAAALIRMRENRYKKQDSEFNPRKDFMCPSCRIDTKHGQQIPVIVPDADIEGYKDGILIYSLPVAVIDKDRKRTKGSTEARRIITAEK
jgi:hypothetical protein